MTKGSSFEFTAEAQRRGEKLFHPLRLSVSAVSQSGRFEVDDLIRQDGGMNSEYEREAV
jgi:hypothetical protein